MKNKNVQIFETTYEKAKQLALLHGNYKTSIDVAVSELLERSRKAILAKINEGSPVKGK